MPCWQCSSAGVICCSVNLASWFWQSHASSSCSYRKNVCHCVLRHENLLIYGFRYMQGVVYTAVTQEDEMTQSPTHMVHAHVALPMFKLIASPYFTYELSLREMPANLGLVRVCTLR